MTGPERRAIQIARGNPHIAAQKLAKLSSVRFDVAKRTLDAEHARRAGTA
jgi:hypothetical protein